MLDLYTLKLQFKFFLFLLGNLLFGNLNMMMMVPIKCWCVAQGHFGMWSSRTRSQTTALQHKIFKATCLLFVCVSNPGSRKYLSYKIVPGDELLNIFSSFQTKSTNTVSVCKVQFDRTLASKICGNTSRILVLRKLDQNLVFGPLGLLCAKFNAAYVMRCPYSVCANIQARDFSSAPTHKYSTSSTAAVMVRVCKAWFVHLDKLYSK